MKNLGQLINRHAADLDPHKGFAKLAKLDLVILDDVGYFDVTATEANGFLALIEATYQHTSLAITSNSHPSRFADLMPQVRPTQGPDPWKVDTSGVSYAAWVSVADVSASKSSGARRLHQECRLRVL